jgi:lysophospholipase L1-like esterase
MNKTLSTLLLLLCAVCAKAQQTPLSAQKTKAQIDSANWANFQKQIEYGLHNDWPNLKRYEDANEKLEALPADSNRVVFIGNSITDNWGNLIDPDFFKINPYICRGIGGQTTPQMLVRFREDVINLKPTAVVILAGTNDIAENTGPSKLENVFGNIVSMAELAKANNIRVVLCSVLPAYDFPWHPGLHPAERIVKLNEMIKKYADKNNIVYTDYYDVMVDNRQGLKKELALDGVVHPNMAGYKIMEPLVKKAIDEALKRE